MARFRGTKLGDDIHGTQAADQIDGGAGNDDLFGQGGDDLIEGGTGNDDLFGEAGDDQLLGGAGGDYLVGGVGSDTYRPGTGDDYLNDDGYWEGDGDASNARDVFVFEAPRKGNFGHDYIQNFDDDQTDYGDAGQDVIHFQGYTEDDLVSVAPREWSETVFDFTDGSRLIVESNNGQNLVQGEDYFFV
jgi:Ca2+-binding RTX toxin-like protein